MFFLGLFIVLTVISNGSITGNVISENSISNASVIDKPEEVMVKSAPNDQGSFSISVSSANDEGGASFSAIYFILILAIISVFTLLTITIILRIKSPDDLDSFS